MIGLDSFLEILFALLVGHALADYPLQGPFLAQAKNPLAPIKDFPWYHAMGAHALIHGGMVFVITGSLFLGLLEALIHFYIDRAKCRGTIDVDEDQVAHILCKVIWATWA